MKKMLIIFRCCDDVYSIHSTSRPNNLSKKQIIKKCYNSLKTSVNKLTDVQIKIVIMGDNLSNQTIAIFDKNDQLIKNNKMGNVMSLTKCYLYALKNKDQYDYVYFCQDDYYHDQKCLKYCLDFLINKNEYLQNYSKYDMMIHPRDYPDRYMQKFGSDGIYPSYIFLSKYCHWRQTRDTTRTFMLQMKLFEQIKDILIRNGQDDRSFSKKLYHDNKILCFQPLPGLRSHMHSGVLTPFLTIK